MMAWHWIQSPEHLQGARDVQLGFESFNVNGNVTHPKDSRCVNATRATLKTIYCCFNEKNQDTLYSFPWYAVIWRLCESDESLQAMTETSCYTSMKITTMPPHTSFKWANDSIVKIGCSYIEPEIEFSWIFESNFRDVW